MHIGCLGTTLTVAVEDRLHVLDPAADRIEGARYIDALLSCRRFEEREP
jgi:hypothetical protein